METMQVAITAWWPGRGRGQGLGKNSEAVKPCRPRLQAESLALLNAEEESIYPTDIKIQVLQAQQTLKGVQREESIALHEDFELVVRVAALYRLVGGKDSPHAIGKRDQDLHALLRFELSRFLSDMERERRRARLR
ncbi:unnamed protein product, partial [Discosporangium mesarthrocarpum]